MTMKWLRLQGGVFTVDDRDGRVFALVRDKDMPLWLDKTESSLGFLGSDTFQQLPEDVRGDLSFEKIGINGVRFAFAARRDKLEQVRQKLARKETLNIVTSYPASSRECVGQLGSAVRVVASPGGSVEVAPKLIPEIDGIIDLVDKGNTILANGLEIVRDNLQPVELGAVWKAKVPAERPNSPEIPSAALSQAIARIETRVAEADNGARDSNTQLLAADKARLIAKLREEVDEAIEAFETGTTQDLAQEIADVLYPLSIMGRVRDTSFRDSLRIFATER